MINHRFRDNPCITMHQPWASLLVYGIKRIEGRSWPSPLTGTLWIHAAGKVPEVETIQAMENFYREIYTVDGVTDIKFPASYPTSRLLGCVDVVGSVKSEELVHWDKVPEGVRLEGLTKFCWLCEEPKKIMDPIKMRGFHGVYNLQKEIFEAAIRSLHPVDSPLPVKFPLPDPQDPFSLKPGSIKSSLSRLIVSDEEKPERLIAAIAGARAAATQFSKEHKYQNNTDYRDSVTVSTIKQQVKKIEYRTSHAVIDRSPQLRVQNHRGQSNLIHDGGFVSKRTDNISRIPNQQPQVSVDVYNSTVNCQEKNEGTVSRIFVGILKQQGVNYEEKSSKIRLERNKSEHNNSPGDLTKPPRLHGKMLGEALKDSVSLESRNGKSNHIISEGNTSGQKYAIRSLNQLSQVPINRSDLAMKHQGKVDVTSSCSSSGTKQQQINLLEEYKKPLTRSPTDCQPKDDDAISHGTGFSSQNCKVQHSSQMSCDRKPRVAITLYKAPSEPFTASLRKPRQD